MAIDIEAPGGNETALQNALRKLVLTSRGALVGLSTDLTTIDASGGYQVPFDAESYDTDTIHDNATNNTRLTVPSGYGLVRVGFSLRMTLITGSTLALARIRHSNSSGVEQSRRGLPAFSAPSISSAEFYASGCSHPVPVSAGDYFELRIFASDTSITLDSTYTAAFMELLTE